VFSGAGSAALASINATCNATLVFAGSGSAALAVGATGIADYVIPGISGSGSAALSALSAVGASALMFSGVGSAACAPLTAAGAGAESFEGYGSAAFALTASGEGQYTAPPKSYPFPGAVQSVQVLDQPAPMLARVTAQPVQPTPFTPRIITVYQPKVMALAPIANVTPSPALFQVSASASQPAPLSVSAQEY
jgi:hypothetical protein